MSKVAIGVGADTRWLGGEEDGVGFAAAPKVLWAGRAGKEWLKDSSADGLGETVVYFPKIGF